jgi:hypothetical protein
MSETVHKVELKHRGPTPDPFIDVEINGTWWIANKEALVLCKLAINHSELSILTIIFFFKVAVIFIALKAGRFP